MKKFKITDIIAGTEHISEPYAESELGVPGIEWLETSMSAGNDMFIRKLDSGKKKKLIVRISSISEYELYLDYHLKALGREKADILLLDPSGDWEGNLKDLEQNGRGVYFDALGIGGVRSLVDLERYERILGKSPEYISLRMNPLMFFKEGVDYAKEHGVKIIGYQILGDNNEESLMIQRFSLQFLCEFAASWCDMVVVQTKNPDLEWREVEILKGCIDRDINNESVYALTKTSKRWTDPVDPGKIKVGLYTKVGKEYLGVEQRDVVLQDGGVIFSEITTDPQIIPPDLESLEDGDILKSVYTDLGNIDIPADMKDPGEIESVYRYSIIALLLESYPDRFFRYTHTKYSGLTAIEVKRRYPIPGVPKVIRFIYKYRHSQEYGEPGKITDRIVLRIL
jgi:hypothetical protein